MDVSTGVASASTAVATATGTEFDPASVAAALPTIDLPLLQSSAQHQQHGNLHQTNGSAAATPSGFYPPSYPYASADTGASASVPYSSLISSYNPYSAIPPLEFNMIFNPWGFVDIAAEGPLTAAIEHQTGTTAPFLTPTFSPQVNNTFNTMSRYGTRASTAANNGLDSNGSANRKGGRRPKEYDHTDLNHEDKEKRDKRRQRNKEAAARCRKRRLDLMYSLQQQKDDFERRSNQMASRYQALETAVQRIIQELQSHRCPMNDTLQHHIDQCTNVLRQSQEFNNQMINQQQQQQHHQQMAQINQQQVMMASNPSSLLPHVSTLQAGNKRTHDEISGGPMDEPLTRPSTLMMKDDMHSPDSNFDDSLSTSYDMPPYKDGKFDDSPVDVQRPTSLNINNWDQTPVISTPSACLPTFIKTMIPEFNNMLNQQTFLTPTAPSAVTVTSSGGPPQSDDLQTL